jgi:hypothetical protein
LVVLTAVGEQTEQDFEGYLAKADRLLQRRELYASIFDARRAAPIGPRLRKRQAEWIKQNEPLLRSFVVATSLVMTSALHRGIFRAISWMQPLPYPHSIDTSLAKARDFTCAHLAKRGCPTPPMFGWDDTLQRLADRDSVRSGSHDQPRRPLI